MSILYSASALCLIAGTSVFMTAWIADVAYDCAIEFWALSTKPSMPMARAFSPAAPSAFAGMMSVSLLSRMTAAAQQRRESKL